MVRYFCKFLYFWGKRKALPLQ